MMRSHTWLAVPLVFVLLTHPARADHEDAAEHAKHPTHTVVLDSADVRPSTVSMDKGDTLVFENQSLQPITVTFTEPEELGNKVRCGLVKPKPGISKSDAPWQLFAWNNGKLSAVIPPGRFASMCSLADGSYAFTAERGVRRAGSIGSALPAKGRIVVQ